jgi:hypothetical protein
MLLIFPDGSHGATVSAAGREFPLHRLKSFAGADEKAAWEASGSSWEDSALICYQNLVTWPQYCGPPAQQGYRADEGTIKAIAAKVESEDRLNAASGRRPSRRPKGTSGTGIDKILNEARD